MSENWLDRLEGLLFVLLSGFMIWPNGITSTSIIVLLIIRIYRLGSDALPPWKKWWFTLPVFIVFLSWIFWMFPPDGVREVKLWPLLIAAFIVFYRNSLHQLFLQGFIWLSLLQAVIVIIYLAFQPAFDPQFFSFQIRESISLFYKTHPTYLSAGWFFAAFLAIWFVRFPLLKWSVVVILFLGASLAGGKMPLLGFLIITALSFWLRIENVKTKWITVLAILAVGIAAIWFNPAMKQRFQELTSLNTDYKEGDMLSSSDLRIGIWQCSWQTILENPLTGVGSGNTRRALETCFEQFNQVEFFDGEYNTHNQFLHFGLLAGFEGLLFFLVYMVVLIGVAIKHRNWMLFFFGLYCFILFQTENYFGRQLGMVFFSVFASLGFGNPRMLAASSLLYGSR